MIKLKKKRNYGILLLLIFALPLLVLARQSISNDDPGKPCTEGCVNRPSENDGKCDEFTSIGVKVYDCKKPWFYQSNDCVKGLCAIAVPQQLYVK